MLGILALGCGPAMAAPSEPPDTLFGSYHVFASNLFYANIRFNAKERVLSFPSGEDR